MKFGLMDNTGYHGTDPDMTADDVASAVRPLLAGP